MIRYTIAFAFGAMLVVAACTAASGCTPSTDAAIAPRVPAIEVAVDAADAVCATFEPAYAPLCRLADDELDATLDALVLRVAAINGLDGGAPLPLPVIVHPTDRAGKLCACHDLARAIDAAEAGTADAGAR